MCVVHLSFLSVVICHVQVDFCVCCQNHVSAGHIKVEIIIIIKGKQCDKMVKEMVLLCFVFLFQFGKWSCTNSFVRV